MLECIKEVNEVIKLPSTIVRLLLHHCHWDKQKLMERFYDPIDQPALFRQAHIVNPQERSPALTPAVEQTCAICCSTKPSHEMCGLGCGHVFCKVCWQRYLTTKIMDEGIELSVPCPTECDDPVDDRTVLDLIEAQTVRQKYQYLITQSFVEYNGNMRWCPGTICTDAIEASNRDVAMASIDDLLIIHDRDKDLFSKTTGTSCETSFCFQCGQSWHEPIRCEWLERWQKKCNDDSETNHWIAVNAKDCPECHTTMGKLEIVRFLSVGRVLDLFSTFDRPTCFESEPQEAVFCLLRPRNESLLVSSCRAINPTIAEILNSSVTHFSFSSSRKDRRMQPCHVQESILQSQILLDMFR